MLDVGNAFLQFDSFARKGVTILATGRVFEPEFRVSQFFGYFRINGEAKMARLKQLIPNRALD
jgi:hypothetical protein